MVFGGEEALLGMVFGGEEALLGMVFGGEEALLGMVFGGEEALLGMVFGRVCMRMYATVSLSAAARRQLQRYLSVQDGDHKAHQLMGQVCVEQERVAQALTHFRRSLEIKGDQPELVLIGGCVTCCHAPILHPFLSSTHYSAPPPLSRPTLHPCPALPSLPCIHLIPPTTPLFCSPLLNPTPPLPPPFQPSTPLTFLPLFCPTPYHAQLLSCTANCLWRMFLCIS